MSGIVWTYAPNGSSNHSTNYIHNSPSNSTNNNNIAGIHPHIAQRPYNRLADGNGAVANNNNGNNNLIGHHQQQQPPPVPPPGQPQQQQQMPGVRLPSAERDTTNNSGVNHQMEENKKFKVSISFDR